jgi:hypothetical protein
MCILCVETCVWEKKKRKWVKQGYNKVILIEEGIQVANITCTWIWFKSWCNQKERVPRRINKSDHQHGHEQSGLSLLIFLDKSQITNPFPLNSSHDTPTCIHWS